MTACTRSALAMLTDCCSSDDIEATARRTGFVKRASQITGTLFLALVTFGSWSDAQTTLAQLAAKVPQVMEHVEVSPEAIHQRMNTWALVFLQDMIRQALAKVQALEHVGADGLFTAFTKGSLADSTGFGLPDRLADLFPGSGGSATKAGAKMQAVWDYKSSVFGHFALTPWNIPEQTYVATVVALAHKGGLFIFALGYFKLKAFARIVDAGASFLSRLNHQTTILDAASGRVQPLALASLLKTVVGNSLEHAIFLGAKEQVASRLVAYRLPEAGGNERRRRAKKNARKKGYTPSQAHLARLAWNLFITNVPRTIWKTETGGTADPIRWQVELILKSWKSYLHLASIKTKKADTTLCYLYGRMLLILLNDALCPHMRHPLWLRKKRARSLLKLVRHFQALAERWMQAIFQSEWALRRFLTRACATAERLAAKAVRKRRTTAQILRASLEQQHESIEFAAVVNA
jgi:Transposase DDE domain